VRAFFLPPRRITLPLLPSAIYPCELDESYVPYVIHFHPSRAHRRTTRFRCVPPFFSSLRNGDDSSSLAEKDPFERTTLRLSIFFPARLCSSLFLMYESVPSLPLFQRAFASPIRFRSLPPLERDLTRNFSFAPLCLSIFFFCR